MRGTFEFAPSPKLTSRQVLLLLRLRYESIQYPSVTARKATMLDLASIIIVTS